MPHYVSSYRNGVHSSLPAYTACPPPTQLNRRYWAIAIPSAVFVTWTVAVLVYIAVNFMSTAPLDSFDTITGMNTLFLCA